MTYLSRSFLLLTLLACLPLRAQDLPEAFPELRFHLTARPWQPLGLPDAAYLDVVEGICRVAAGFQDAEGAIVDPYLGREHQYATPYFAFGVGTLLHAGRPAEGLREAGIRAMEHATASFAAGSAGIPDAHGEFFIAPLTHALALYWGEVSEETHARWRTRLETPLSTVMQDFTGRINNWRTYAMKGEWARAQAGLVAPDTARAFVEASWTSATQRERIAQDRWNLYQDWSSDPQSHAVEAVGRGNLAALVAEGYDGPSAAEIRRLVRRGTQAALLLQAPDGQSPPNGRTDNHVFNDVLYGLLFETMAEDAWARGAHRLAGQYRRAALLSLRSIRRWRRTSPPWTGSFFVTKNHFDPALRVGYQPASQWGNYNGALMLHLSEAYLTRQTAIPEAPAPAEIGGYALRTDAAFSTFAANAGGMHVFANLRGASVPKYGLSWTPLGVVRFGRTGWDGRLGPGDGEHDRAAGGPLGGRGITFAPTWQEQGRWVRMADLHEHYRATPQVTFVHPLLVRFDLVYHYATGRGGPYFRHEFTVTPDGVLTRLTSPQGGPLAVTLPLLEDDGRPLQTAVADGIARTRYAEGSDEQHFLSLTPGAVLEPGGASIRSTYGWLKPVRVRTDGEENVVFVYPRRPDDPTGTAVRESFRLTEDGFSSALGRVAGNRYVGRTSAGGEGDRIDLDGDGAPEVTFSEPCRFVLQLRQGRITAAEADRPVTMRYDGQPYQLDGYTPVDVGP